ncbi:MAG: response regulator transcription factor [Gammaproteobacteria bacterium]|nr:response regulator transcription factor [Gammaproteobacteria bacterium]
MKVLIVDDEPLARKRIRRLLDDIGNCEIVGEATNGKEALIKSGELNPDLVLLDIRMPEMDGLEAARHFSTLPNPPAIIFTTAYSDHALKAFETNAVDYLLKPIRKERLQKAIANTHKLNRAQLSELKLESTEKTTRSHLSVSIRGNIELIPVTDIIYFQAEQKYVNLGYTKGKVLIEDSLKSLENEFSELVFRIHRNALVAKHYLEGIEKNSEGQYCIKLRDTDTKLEISRRYLPQIRKKLKNISQ